MPVLGVAATWLPWFQYDDRPIFLFYAVATVPFTIIAIALAVNALRLRATTPGPRLALAVAVTAYLAVVVALFCYFHPIWTDALIPYDSWRSRMWFSGWI